jgi:hypothetical protein
MSRPESSFFAVGGIIRLIAFVWVAALAINLPISFYTDTLVVPSGPTTTMVVCARLIYMDPYVQEVFQVTGRIFVFFVPLALTWASYAGIYWKMTRTKRKVGIDDSLLIAVNDKIYHCNWRFFKLNFFLTIQNGTDGVDPRILMHPSKLALRSSFSIPDVVKSAM